MNRFDSFAMTKIEEALMWVGKGFRDDLRSKDKEVTTTTSKVL